ncbi:MAG: helix-turn-helix domain-containing protein [Lachnospiraceae bacterium]|nr:helix-turn-helix domain-containing protein [Lachnospiraceae bacterium]
MGAMEIVLLLIGGIIFVLSFVIPAKKEEMSKEAKKAAIDEIKTMIEDEMSDAKGRIEDIVDETVTYSIEKTERALERVSNEKIMAVNEYSDTVLEEIGKSHKEVLFLYDMLNDKQQNLQETVTAATQTAKAVEQTVLAAQYKQPEEPEFDVLKVPVVKVISSVAEEESNQQDPSYISDVEAIVEEVRQEEKAKPAKKKEIKGEKKNPVKSPDISFMPSSSKAGKNNNERILELHAKGKSNVAIAKELGLGIGEVKLVIDLFEGM